MVPPALAESCYWRVRHSVNTLEKQEPQTGREFQVKNSERGFQETTEGQDKEGAVDEALGVCVCVCVHLVRGHGTFGMSLRSKQSKT